MEGFSLQAGTHVHELDREGLEHLLRYALRPPLSLDRLSRTADGRVQGFLDGAPLFEYGADRPLEVGMWTKAHSLTHFADLKFEKRA